jgi:hypothetical protein
VEAQTIAVPEEARACHILFVPRAQSERADPVVTAVIASGGVSVGESDTFLDRGGTINLFVEEGRVRFSMRPHEAERRGVRFSSHLLRLARTRPDAREMPR